MIYRQVASDFRVEEIPLFSPSGEGNHWFLLIEKEGRDSAEVARALAAENYCRLQEVGMAGRKDRHAITRQWFSVPVAPGVQTPHLSLAGTSVLEVSKHHQRLRTGQLLGNRFSLTVRNVEAADHATIMERVAEIESLGFANRFGHQRFGRDGDNAQQGREILLGSRAPRNRRLARFLVSALQSELFNVTLRLRHEEVGLQTLVDGDLVLVHATGGVFWIDSAEKEQQRAGAFEISPTGPMMGDKMRKPFGVAGQWEEAALRVCELEEGLFRSRRGLRLFGARRALRALPDDLSVERHGDTARFSFRLAPGCYASVFLEEACGPNLLEADRDSRGSVPGGKPDEGEASDAHD